MQARLAQSVEHETLNLRVVGSSPTLGAPPFVPFYLAVIKRQSDSETDVDHITFDMRFFYPRWAVAVGLGHPFREIIYSGPSINDVRTRGWGHGKAEIVREVARTS